MVDNQAPAAPIKIHKYDANAVKRTLDESAAQIICDAFGYTEDNHTSNLKLLTCSACVGLALLAQFYPLNFPDNYWLLVVCCVLYGILCNGVLQYISAYMEENFILFTKPKSVTEPALQIRTKLPRHEYDYTLSIGKRGAAPEQEVSFTAPVGSYFDENGVFVQPAFHADVVTLYNTYASKKRS